MYYLKYFRSLLITRVRHFDNRKEIFIFIINETNEPTDVVQNLDSKIVTTLHFYSASADYHFDENILYKTQRDNCCKVAEFVSLVYV